MSENSSDSDSSCGWTVISHEGSDVEMVNSVTVTDSCELTPERSSLEPEELQVLQIKCGGGESSENSTLLMGETAYPTLGETKSAIEAREAMSPEDNVYFGTVSDDSDIVTLEPPKLEEMVKDAPSLEDFNMGSSSSSQYTFCQPETVFSSQPSDDESSSDETSNQPSPAPRRRRGRKKTVSTSEPEEQLQVEADQPPQGRSRRHFSGGLNKCVILALVIAVSMGFGHFYGTIQIQKRQHLVRKIHENELNDVKNYLSQCQQEQESFIDSMSLKENLARCWTLTEAEKISSETQKNNLAAENQYLRMSLEKEEKAVLSLQEELRQLREQIRILEDKGSNSALIKENQVLKQHLEVEKQKADSFVTEREMLLEEAKVLKKDKEKEQLLAMALTAKLEQLGPSQSQDDSASASVLTENREVVLLQQRLAELEQKLTFEQQRSDLWERLYVEAKDQNEKQKPDGEKKGSRGSRRARSESKESFLGTVKETFDAMKNSTKEFVRHHKEKIKQAKEAVKENLKKFSDSVKSTFRHFKDTTKNIFDEVGNKRFRATKEEKLRTAFRDFLHPQRKTTTQNQNYKGPAMQRDGKREKPRHFEEFRKNTDSQKCNSEHDHGETRSFRRTCSGVFECAGQESIKPFNILCPVRIHEFRQLIERYLLNELGAFHHWKELDEFISKFFLNGVFRHDQKLFTDFVSDVKGYLKDMKEYQVDDVDAVLEKLDGYVHGHFGHAFPLPYGPSRPDKKQRMVNIENSRHRKQEQKQLQPQSHKREGKWHKHGRTNGGHVASLEIELERLPFDPKY